MSLKKDIIGAEVQIGTNEAQASLTKLSQETATLTNENDRLRISQAKLKALGKGYEDQLKKINDQITQNNKTITTNKAQMDALRKTIGITEMSIPQLRKRASELRKELGLMGNSADPVQFKKLNNELIATERQMAKNKARIGETQGIMSKLNGVAGGFLPALAPAAIIAAILSIGKGLFKLTSQIQGEAIRSTTVLGDQFGFVEEQAEKLAAKMGVTNREFISMVANTGDLLIPLDFSRKKAAEMATQVQSLSGALDEWTSGKYGVAEVSEILTKAMLGEMEQLKGLGIAIRQDSKEFTDLVKQKELDEGATNAQARAMATLELIYKKSTDAQTAYEREGNKVLRWAKGMNLWWKNLKESAANYLADTRTEGEKMIDEFERSTKIFDQNSKAIDPLITKYDSLKSKTKLNADEQKELKGVIQQISKIVPGAITSFDEYGTALDINKGLVYAAIEAQRLYNVELNKKAINSLADDVRDENYEISRYTFNIDRLTKSINDLTAVGLGESYNAKQQIERRQNEINLRNSAIAAIQKHIFQLKSLGLTEEEISQQTGISITEVTKQMNGYIQVIKERNGLSTDETKAITSLIAAQEKLLEDAKKMPETTEGEIAAKNRKIELINEEIKRLKELGLVKKENEATSAIDKAHAAEILRIKEYYSDKEQLDKEYKSRLLASDLAYLLAKSNIETDEEKKLQLQSQIIDKQREYTTALKESVPELIKNEQAGEKLNTRLLEQAKLMKLVSNKQNEASNDASVLTKKLQSQAEMYQQAIGVVSEGLFDMMSGSEDAFKGFAKNILIFALEQLKLQAQIAAAGVTVQSLAQPDSIATFGASGLVRAAIIVGLIEAAFAGLEGLVSSAFSSKGKKAGGYTTTATTDDLVVDYVHSNEFVGNAKSVRNPTVKPVFDIIDMAQRNGTIETLNLPAVLGAIGRRTGGYGDISTTTTTVPAATNLTQPYTPAGLSPSDVKKFADAVDKLSEYRPELVISDYERRRDNWKKTTSGGIRPKSK